MPIHPAIAALISNYYANRRPVGAMGAEPWNSPYLPGFGGGPSRAVTRIGRMPAYGVIDTGSLLPTIGIEPHIGPPRFPYGIEPWHTAPPRVPVGIEPRSPPPTGR